MDFTPNGQDLITAVFIAFLGVIGWAIKAQITTNKDLSKAIGAAIAEIKLAMQNFDQRDKSQQQVCEFHRKNTEAIRQQTDDLRRHTNAEIKKIHHEIDLLKNAQ